MQGVYVFNAETEQIAYLGRSAHATSNFPSHSTLISESGQVIAFDSQQGSLIRVARHEHADIPLSEVLKTWN